MVNDEFLDTLRYRSEGTDLDFKSEQYRFVGGNEHQKSEMLKDVLAMANAWRDGTGYILLGFKENRPHLAEVVGISESIDDSRLQQFVNSKVKPKLTFRYEEHLYKGKTVGVIVIPKQKRPFFIAKPYGKLKSNITYVRRGSSTEEAEPTEIGDMVLADSGRGKVLLDLSVLTPRNDILPDSIALEFLSFPEKLPDYEVPPATIGNYGISIRSPMSRENTDFWRECAEYIRVNTALIEMKFLLMNRSEVSLSDAKLEVSVSSLDGQFFQMRAGTDLPCKPSTQWDFSDLKIADQKEARLYVDESGVYPVCHVRFGSLLPGEEGRSSDTLAILPSGPGRLRLNFRILAGELAEPQELERLLEITGESLFLGVAELKGEPGKALFARYTKYEV